jgi:hypothetical protein
MFSNFTKNIYVSKMIFISESAVRRSSAFKVEGEIDDGADEHDGAQFEQVLHRALLQRFTHRLENVGDDEKLETDQNALSRFRLHPNCCNQIVIAGKYIHQQTNVYHNKYKNAKLHWQSIILPIQG